MLLPKSLAENKSGVAFDLSSNVLRRNYIEKGMFRQH